MATNALMPSAARTYECSSARVVSLWLNAQAALPLVGSLTMRFALAIVFIWFGLLKVVGESPVADLVTQSVFWLPAEYFLPGLGTAEMLLGVGILVPRTRRISLVLLIGHLLTATLLTLVTPATSFQHGNPFLLTTEGQYVIKNGILIGAALVMLGQIAEGRSEGPPARAQENDGFRRGYEIPNRVLTLLRSGWATASVGVVVGVLIIAIFQRSYLEIVRWLQGYGPWGLAISGSVVVFATLVAFAGFVRLSHARTGEDESIADREARALLAKGVTLGRQERWEEAIAAYDVLVARMADRPGAAVSEQVAKAMLAKGVTLVHLERKAAASGALQDLVQRLQGTHDEDLAGFASKARNLLTALAETRQTRESNPASSIAAGPTRGRYEGILAAKV